MSKVELYERIRRDRRLEPDVGIRELARRYRVHRRDVRQALASAVPPARKTPQRASPRWARTRQRSAGGCVRTWRRRASSATPRGGCGSGWSPEEGADVAESTYASRLIWCLSAELSSYDDDMNTFPVLEPRLRQACDRDRSIGTLALRSTWIGPTLYNRCDYD